MIEFAFFDIDGVLTDGVVYIDSDGLETKKISFDDIDAIFELKRSGIKIGFITGEDNNFTEYVRKRFSPDYFAAGCKDKLSYFKMLEKSGETDKTKTCFVGDSKKDIELLRYIYFSFTPSNVDDEIKNTAKFVTNAVKGKGVIKEVTRFILNKRNSKNIDSFWKDGIYEHLKVTGLLLDDENLFIMLSAVAKVLVEAFKSGRKLLICGNGGSAADSQHLSTELVSRFFFERKALDAEALTVNTSSLTAIGNDYSFDKVFSRQVEAKGKQGDVLIGISTSGNSKNVIEAIKVAKDIGIKTIGLTGNKKDSLIYKFSDYCICVPSHSTPRIQEAHILIGHMLCEFIERELFGEKG